MLKITNEKKLNHFYSIGHQLEKIEILNDILNEIYDVESYVQDDNENIIEFYEIYDYDVIEIMDDINIKYEIIYVDENEKIVEIKIDDDEFIVKNSIESYDELLKHYKENSIIDSIELNVMEFNELFNEIGMNKYYDYIHRLYYLTNNFYSFKFHTGHHNFFMLNKFKKIFDNNFLNLDIELFDDLDNLYYDDDIEFYKNYDVELFDDEFIVINHNDRSIKNIDDDELNELFVQVITDYLTIDNKYYLYDSIIELLNIIHQGYYKIFKYDDQLYKLISLDINDDLDELIDEFKYYYDSYELNKFENKYLIKIIPMDYDELDDELNLYDVIEFIDDYVSIDYDDIYYKNFIALNNLFYGIFKKYHMNIDEKIYDNIRKLNQIKI